MEGLFRTNLSDVRVHVGPEAAALGAFAFTHRTDIYFAPGQYAPHSAHGERLLAHELTHVVQQRAGRVRCPAGSGSVVVHDLGLEAEAERMSALASSVRPAPGQPLQARLAAPPPPRPVIPPSTVPAPAVQPFGLWLTRKILDWTEPHWRRRNELIGQAREARELYASLSGDAKRRPKVARWAQRLREIDPWQTDPSGYSDLRNELGTITTDLKDEKLLVSRLAEASSHFQRTGTSLYKANQHWISDTIDETQWNRLTSLGRDMPNVKKKARQGNQRALATLTYYLFRKFLAAGFQYQIMQSRSSGLVGASTDVYSGNCIAYALTFANVLISFGIDAEAEYIREEDKGHFIVRLDQFIDPSVRGHIYAGGILQAGYYMFNSHAATWVPSLGKYFDPMACTSYTSLDPYIECEITSNEAGTEFRPSTVPKSLFPNRQWKLVRKNRDVAGGFAKLKLVDDV